MVGGDAARPPAERGPPVTAKPGPGRAGIDLPWVWHRIPPDRPGGGVPGGLNRVLRTKLTPPRAHAGGLERAQLVARLNAEMAPGRVGLVVAPAGWGKSALLGSWFAQLRPRRAHLRCAGREVPARLLSAPRTTALGDVIPALLNELAAQTEPIILVVDDYQSITHRDIQEGVALLVERMPPAPTPPSHEPTRRPCWPASSTSSSSSSRWTNIASGSPAANPRSWP
ncbi:MAG: transcriptional regulator [Pseudonocardia sp.]|nr:transcriptional regulator [Pseudonocardia sp.]